jgi:hypothetical protein
MKKPEDLLELLENLKEAGERSSVQLGQHPKAIVYIGERTLTLGGKDCSFLLNTPETAKKFAASLGCTIDMGLELHDLEIEPDVTSVLECSFSTVDEL